MACLLILDAVQSAAGGALNGLRDAKGPLLIAVAGSWGVGVPAGLLLAGRAAVPAAGMWWGLALGTAAAAALSLARLYWALARVTS